MFVECKKNLIKQHLKQHVLVRWLSVNTLHFAYQCEIVVMGFGILLMHLGLTSTCFHIDAEFHPTVIKVFNKVCMLFPLEDIGILFFPL